MKPVLVIAAVLIAAAIGYQVGDTTGNERGIRERVDIENIAQLHEARMDARLTEAQFDHDYERAYAPAFYGHPRNWQETRIIMDFNGREAKAWQEEDARETENIIEAEERERREKR